MEWKASRKYESGLQEWTHTEDDSHDVKIHTFWSAMGFTVETKDGQTPCINSLEDAKVQAEGFIVARRTRAAALAEKARLAEEHRAGAKDRRNARDRARRQQKRLAAKQQGQGAAETV